jgi:hypothetical protein
VPSTGRELARDVDHELADREQREQDVVAKGEVALQGFSRRHPGPELSEMVEVPSQLGEALDQVGHRRMAASLT